ncbi:hypothetical protein HYN86_09815 [Flavobacterium fluviale]|uniref:Uncharacterized protein n=1 Tax=Flavobacterium fluviale TaxID=2249356 RepID=A0A344LSH9_9FLAO|nr:hypothetical protein HYN86_09815 [Flavobacterium fluviale]
MAYDAVRATDEHPNSWVAIEADKSLIKASMNVHDLYHKDVNDPFNNQPIKKRRMRVRSCILIFWSQTVLTN